jgi:putative ABC transport system permease protein
LTYVVNPLVRSSCMAIGLAAVLLAARLVSALLYRVSPADPLGLLASVLVVATVAVLAAHVPARRAVRVDPILVLRRE